ncbi:hypothetical protein [Colwellia sp. 12G3]|uniref:hypothetical protein n=1 Tax=Colwellia sp. 12G3 TaxID=2058299 RepID=UPI000C3315F0|nr:hypothetical protein [Colwellia sp. 12G3]PKI17106.1 hypothetical protein CXF71_07695 [Colwellia sp. 12G3]
MRILLSIPFFILAAALGLVWLYSGITMLGSLMSYNHEPFFRVLIFTMLWGAAAMGTFSIAITVADK